METRKHLIAVWAIFFSALYLPAALAETSQPTTLKLGAVLPLSGELAFLGEEVKRGIQLALDKTAKQGNRLQVIYEDDQSLVARVAASAAQKLTALDKVDAAVSLIVEQAHPMAPIFNRSKVPLLLLWDSNESIESAGSYIFSNGFSTEKAGKIMARFSQQELGLKRIAIARHTNPWAEIISKAFQAEFGSLGGKIIYDQEFDVQQTDYRTALLEIKKLQPDGVYFPMIPPHSALFLTQARQLGLTTQMLTGDPLIQDVIDKAGTAAEEVYYTNYFTEKTEQLERSYTAKFSSAPQDVSLVSFGYQGIMLILEAAQLAQRSDITLREALQSLLGENRSADKTQRIYRVIKGLPAEVKAQSSSDR